MFFEGAEYLLRLRRQLGVQGPEAEEILREIEDHLDDRIEELTAKGFQPQEARRIALRGLGAPNVLAYHLREGDLVSTWPQTLLGALPPLLAGGALLLHFGSRPVGLAAIATIALLATLWGLRLGRPPWFYSWAGLCVSFLFLFGYLAYLEISRDLPQLLDGRLRPLPLFLTASLFLYMPLALFVSLAILWLALRRDWLDASVVLSPLPGMLLVIKHLHALGPNTDISTDLIAICVVAAIATAAYLRSPTRSWRICVLIACALILSLLATALISGTGVALSSLLNRQVVLVLFLLSPAVIAQRLPGYRHRF